jgi:hypothetical protein
MVYRHLIRQIKVFHHDARIRLHEQQKGMVRHFLLLESCHDESFKQSETSEGKMNKRIYKLK